MTRARVTEPAPAVAMTRARVTEPARAVTMTCDGVTAPAVAITRAPVTTLVYDTTSAGKTVTLVDDVDPETVVIELRAQFDPATAMNECVGHELAHQEGGVGELEIIVLGAEPVCQLVPRRSRR